MLLAAVKPSRRCMAIDEVQRLRSGAHSVCPTARRADYQSFLERPKASEGQRVQRCQGPEAAVDWKAVQRTRSDLRIAEVCERGTGSVERCVERRGRPHACELHDDSFRPTTLIEIVVDD